MVSIVTVNVSQTVAQTPSTLQQTGAFISQGGTTLAPNATAFLTQLSDLTPLLTVAATSLSLVWSGTTVTVTSSAPHGFTIGDTLNVTIAGVLPTGYNGTFTVTVLSTTTFSYALATNPGTQTSPGTYIPSSANVITEMATTFFGQGSALGVYVLELGSGNATDGANALNAWIVANPGIFYSYLIPRIWDNNAAFLAMLLNYESTTAKVYFFVTTTSSTYTSYTPQMKCVIALVESPTRVVGQEFSIASVFWVTLNYSPSSTNKVGPLAFTYVYGVTPYPTKGNGPLLSALKLNGVNYIGTGAEGGISNTMVLWGTTMDVNPYNYWYSADWMQINIDLNLANAVINGSNNPINPLYLDQNGINTLQAAGAATITSAITFGLAIGVMLQSELNGPDFATALDVGTFDGQAVINAVPFTSYYTVSPGDYKIGKYAGFSVTYTPQRGFTSIVFQINVTQFVF